MSQGLFIQGSRKALRGTLTRTNDKMKVRNVKMPGSPAGRRFALRSVNLSRRDATIGVGLTAGLVALPLRAQAWHSTEISGALPALSFTMTRAMDGKEVSATDFKGKVTLLYFGYTFCPDVCPTTLLNLTLVLKRLGPEADQVRVLFVTVDPTRDTPQILKQYTSAFAPQVVGLRGSADQLADLAKRYRVAYSVRSATKDHPYEVTHSSAVYAFDRKCEARLLFSGLATANPDLNDITDDLRALLEQSNHLSVWQRILNTL
jgi:protein SCO1